MVFAVYHRRLDMLVNLQINFQRPYDTIPTQLLFDFLNTFLLLFRA